MIHHSAIQGSEEWKRLRLGMPCASEMDRLITAKRWEPVSGEARRKYLVRLLTERILGCPLDDAVSPAMLHGTDWEAKTRATYCMMNGCDVVDAGFCTNDEGTVGASPDGFVEEPDISVEFKSPFKPEVHMGYVLEPELFKQEYWIQVQSQLYVTQKKAVDLVSGFAGLPMVCVRIEPHPEFQAKLQAALRPFLSDLALLVDLAKTKGWLVESSGPAPVKQKLADDDGGLLGVSQDDITEYLKNIELKREAQKVQGAR